MNRLLTEGSLSLAQNSFVELLNQEANGERFREVVFPPNKLLRAEAKEDLVRQKQCASEHRRQIKQKGSSLTVSKKVAGLLTKLKVLEDELSQAFEIEKEGLKISIRKLRAEILKSKEHLKTLQSLASSKVQPSKNLIGLRAKINQVVEQFPQAQLLDLSALTTFKNEDGLPAVTLFSLDNPNVSLRLNREGDACLESNSNIILSESLHSVLFRNLHMQVSAATGVMCYERSSSSDKALAKAVQVARREGWYKGGKNVLPTLEADEIILETSFTTKSGVIPPEAREIIKRAKACSTFSDVYLLAEIDKWDITYDELEEYIPTVKPWLKGNVISRPKTEDPLIVAPAKIGGKEIWFVLGAFDTTPIERLIRDEYSTNPRN